MAAVKQFLKCSFVPVSLGLCLLSTTGRAQQTPSRNQGGLDGDVPTPTLVQSPSLVPDATALEELQAYAKAVGSLAWQGMQASGTSLYADRTDSLPTTLSMLPGHRVRLAVTTSAGDDVTVVNGEHGYMKSAGGKAIKLPVNTTFGAFAPFDLPGLIALHSEGYAILDLGTVVLDGETLHRISIQADLHNADGADSPDKRSAFDFYFDPATHLLKKSAVMVTIPGAGLHRFLRVLTYSSYQKSGLVLVPASLSETLDGRAIWSLQLTTIDSTTPPSPTNF